jgi:DNA-binding NarL/FixJ family response regulator
MQIIFFSSDINMIEEWKIRHKIENSISCYDVTSLKNITSKLSESFIVIADYDTVSNHINKLIAINQLPDKTIVLEKTPEIASGKMLITHGVKAYGNSRMLSIHYHQMIETVKNNKIWTYPELTIALGKDMNLTKINDDANALIQHRLSPKEIEVVYLILDGLTNDAIASQLNITTRTVKAHISSIFSKLHVNDRLALVLLLK